MEVLGFCAVVIIVVWAIESCYRLDRPAPPAPLPNYCNYTLEELDSHKGSKYCRCCGLHAGKHMRKQNLVSIKPDCNYTLEECVQHNPATELCHGCGLHAGKHTRG